MTAIVSTHVHGHVKITDRATGEILLDRANAIHNKNMAIAIARGLSNEPAGGSGIPKHQIYKLKLGNGGSSIDSMSQITYQPPNVVDPGATLYNTTYAEIVDDAHVGTPAENSVTYLSAPLPDLTSIVITTMTVAAGEPAGQDLSDTPPNPNPEAQYAFDELGLFTSDDLMLTHIIFSPILKTASRELVITYTLTISVS